MTATAPRLMRTTLNTAPNQGTRELAPAGMLGEGELRLVQGLADTLGALLDRARQEDALRRE